MARPPLAAILPVALSALRASLVLAVFLTLSSPHCDAKTQRNKKKKSGVSQAAPDAKLAFEQTFEFVLEQAGKSYLNNERMPDSFVLEPFLAPLKEPDLGKARLMTLRLREVMGYAESVQEGPRGLSDDLYKLIVDQAADDLDVGMIVEQEFVPNARAGRSLDSEEKILVAACQKEARPGKTAAERRSLYQRCLGRRRAEKTYMNRAASFMTMMGTPSQFDQARAGLLREVMANAGLPAEVSEKIHRFLALQLLNPLGLDSGVVLLPSTPSKPPKLSLREPGSGQPNGRATAQPKPPKGLKTITPPPVNPAVDLSAGIDLATIVKNAEIGFTGYCYSYVMAALQKAGIVNKSDIVQAGAAAHAKLFAGFVEKHPALLKRKLLRIPEPSWPLPIGTIVVWSAGACNYSAVSGHIEIVTRIKPPQACSDGCGTFQVACLEELALDPARAKDELPAAQADYRKAQAAYDALTKRTPRKTRRAVTAALKRQKAALADVERRLVPQVAAYAIERKSAPASVVVR